jgi:hypothetical protein
MHGAPEGLKLGAGVDAIVRGPIERIGITIIIDRFPISVIDDNSEDRCPQLINQHIYGRPQFSILPAGNIGVDPKAINGLKCLGAVDDQRSPTPAMAINEIPMTIVEIDTTAAIVKAAMILFRNNPVTDRKLRTWNIGRLLSLFWASIWQVVCPCKG